MRLCRVELGHERTQLLLVTLRDRAKNALLDTATVIGSLEERGKVRIGRVDDEIGNVVVQRVLVLGQPFVGGILDVGSVMGEDESFVPNAGRFELF
jgi:hypothetical protein